MITVRDVIKGREPYSVEETATVLEAAEFMTSCNIGAVCVVDNEGHLSGIFSERDLMKRVIVPRRDPAAVSIREVMSTPRAVIDVTQVPHQALEMMERIGSRHLPVVDGGRWVGMLSMRDVMRVELSEQGDEIRLLHEYISQ